MKTDKIQSCFELPKNLYDKMIQRKKDHGVILARQVELGLKLYFKEMENERD